jgi:ribosomal protein S17
MAVYKKKAWPELFEKVINGKKKFDLRLDEPDFKVNEGDVLILEEWNPKTKEYTGKKIQKKIDFILRTKELKFWNDEQKEKGFVVMSLS